MILVVGCDGMLGADLTQILGDDARGVDADDIDITSPESAERIIISLRPSVVVNCAAYTDVDACESNRDHAMRVNGEAPAYLAYATRRIGAKLVQISTDYVFDGAKKSPYLEDDQTAPLSVYGESKLLGEKNAAINPDHLIVRTQWLYGLRGKNFVETMMRLASERKSLEVVDDQTGSPTWTVDLSRAIVALLDADCRGIFHATNSGSCSWNGFARAIFEEVGMDVVVNTMTTAQLNRPANRPLFSVLNCGKMKRETGLKLRPWREALKGYFAQRGRDGRK